MITLLPDHITADPEVCAMIQAYLSRSPDGIIKYLDDFGSDTTAIKQSLFKWYVGYGHDSIGEQGDVALVFEGISLLAAKALQDNPLYRGTELSTRYNFVDKVYDCEVDSINSIQKEALDLYLNSLAVITENLKKDFPGEGESYERGIKAAAFDIARGILPAGTLTNVSFFGSLTTTKQHFTRLLQHPLHEVRQLALSTLDLLESEYPFAFSKVEYEDEFTNKFYPFYITPAELRSYNIDTPIVASKLIDTHNEYMENRPKGKKVPFAFGPYATYKDKLEIDFGSFRDIQRHRRATIMMPLLRPASYHSWYIDKLSTYARGAVRNLIGISNKLEATSNTVDKYTLQYAVPLATKVETLIHMPFDSIYYVAELRSGTNVHPTLRSFALKLGRAVKRFYPKYPIYLDEMQYIDTKSISHRGNQTIVRKEG